MRACVKLDEGSRRKSFFFVSSQLFVTIYMQEESAESNREIVTAAVIKYSSPNLCSVQCAMYSQTSLQLYFIN